VVRFDGRSPSAATVDRVVARARSRNAKLEFLGVVGRTPWGISVAIAYGLCPGVLREDLEVRILEALRAATARVPKDMSVTSRLIHTDVECARTSGPDGNRPNR
jgi:hypothetical protein